MNNSIIPIIARTDDGELRISSEQIAEGAGTQHKNVLELLENNAYDFLEFGTFAFETRKSAGRPTRLALLNEQQALLLMTYQRNTEQVRAFKIALIKAFAAMAAGINPRVPQTYAEALREHANAVEALEQKNQVIALLEPKAASWDSIVSSEGSWSYNDAAKVLHESGQIEIGEKRLVAWMVDAGFLYRDKKKRPHVYQTFVDRGWFVVKARTYKDYITGEEMVSSAPQVRITGKGLDVIRTRLLAKKEVSA